jgi:hypothetical protein
MRKIDLDRWRVYFTLRDEGHSVERAARRAKIDPHTAWRFERGEPGSTGLTAAEELGVTHVGGLEVAPEISAEARATLEDFGAFRRRYFGRISTPWQERAAYEVLDLLVTPEREYAVINCPPGSGKSTLFTHDIPAWLICRDRSVRIQLGSRTERLARMYVGRLKKTFERETPMVPEAAMKDAGLAYDAKATIKGDFGEFKPEGRTDLWRAEALVVRQFGGPSMDDKEPTVSAWGQDSGFLGGRFDVILWDDLVDRKNSIGDAYTSLCEWWSTEAETRLEPGGVLILQGQRINTDDLYRFVLDLTDLDGAGKYRQIRYQAHNDAGCRGDHGPDAVPQPSGCLLDPWRLPYRFLSNIAENLPRVYDIQYQQNDGQAVSELIEEAWIIGGRDTSGVNRKGCLDLDRFFGKSAQPDYLGWSIVSVDPSPAEFWGITWWVLNPSLHLYECCGIWRRRMGAEAFLAMNLASHEFTGLLEDIRKRSTVEAHPLNAVIIEINAAQKWLMQAPHVQEWSRVHGITLIPHKTAANKADDTYGVKGISDFFRQGVIRLPHGDGEARLAVRPLVHELVTWPDGVTDDLVMSVWFAIRAAQLSYIDPKRPRPRFNRPSWLGRGRSLDEVYQGVGSAQR